MLYGGLSTSEAEHTSSGLLCASRETVHVIEPSSVPVATEVIVKVPPLPVVM
jgi:hypothetical protein